MIVVEQHGDKWVVVNDGLWEAIFENRAHAIEYAAVLAGVKLESEPGR